ncbi:MAG: hypothetical protein ACYS67_02675 [Planctomycetota bacterium]|jgi:hypothetical protein
MNLPKKSSHRYLPGIKTYLLACCLFLILLSAALANSKGKGIGIDNPNASSHINPAGFITGTGGTSAVSPATNKRGALNSNAVTNNGTPKKHFVVKDGGLKFLGISGSNILIQIGAPSGAASLGKNGHISLGAGDAFASAIGNIDATTLEVPNPIGAKGPNPTHGGQHPKKGSGNPGGGNGKGNWGQGNKGNGLGNIFTGNQGFGVGEGMAGVHNSPTDPPEEPPVDPPEEPPAPPEEPPVVVTGSEDPESPPDPAPLYRLGPPALEEEEIKNGGCPALINMLAAELGINAEDLQVAIANTFVSSTNIQACKMAAGLLNAAKILKDPSGSSVASLEQVINEFLTEGAPVSDEQMNQIAAALADHKGDGTYYAMAGEWLDALVKYVDILINDLGFSVDDATTLVMDKYGEAIKDSDNTSLLVAYIDANLLAE